MTVQLDKNLFDFSIRLFFQGIPQYTQHFSKQRSDFPLIFLHSAARKLVNVPHRARLPHKKKFKEKDTQQFSDIITYIAFMAYYETYSQ
jgi:hypothetical protein